jgi:hypothetical protein
MAPELQKYYEDRFSMFITAGWLDLIDDIKELTLSLDQVQNIKSIEDLKYKQGQLDILNWISTLKKVSEDTFDELEKEE